MNPSCRRFCPAKPAPINEEVRLKYRYIDLRRENMQANIQLRHNVALAIRQDLAGARLPGN